TPSPPVGSSFSPVHHRSTVIRRQSRRGRGAPPGRRPDVGERGPGGGAVAAVPRPPHGRVVRLIAQVTGHLLGQRPPAPSPPWPPGAAGRRAEQLHALGMRLA